MTKREIIEIAVFTVILVALAALVGVSAKIYSDKHPSEPSPYIYEYETINVAVTDIDHQRWYTAGGHQNRLDISVYSKEYDLSFSDEFSFHGLFLPAMAELRKGDTIPADMLVVKDRETGAVISRDISAIYPDE